MKRTIQFVALLSFLATPFFLNAFDIGLIVNNRTTLHHDKGREHATYAEERLFLNLYMNHHFQENYFFKAQGHFDLEVHYNHTQKKYQVMPLGNLDRFLIGGTSFINGSRLRAIDFQIGRQFFSDFSHEVAHLIMDGATIGFSGESSHVSLSLGYTGLVYYWINSHNMSLADVSLAQRWDAPASANTEEQKNAFNRFVGLHGAPKFIANLEVKAPSLFSGQNLYFNVLAQADLWNCFNDRVVKKGKTTKEDSDITPMHTLYTGVGLQGFATQYFAYNLFAYLGSGFIYNYASDANSATGYSYQPQGILSGLVGLDLDAYIPQALYSHFNIAFRYASGDKENTDFYDYSNNTKALTKFTPVNSPATNMVFNPSLSNLVTVGASYSFKPFSTLNNHYLDNFVLGLGFKSFIKASDGALSTQYQMTDVNQSYVGTELNVLMNIITISDFNLMTSFGTFFPNADLFIDGLKGPRMEAEINFSFKI